MVNGLNIDSMARYWSQDAENDLTERLWDEKERLLYGETPLFGVFATKFSRSQI